MSCLPGRLTSSSAADAPSPSTCEASAPTPYAGSPFNSINMTVNVSVRHRMLWESESTDETAPVGMCRMGSISWPVKRWNHTLVECEIPAIPATVGEATAIVLKQHTVLYKKCFLNTSAGPTQVLGGHVDESLPTRVRLALLRV